MRSTQGGTVKAMIKHVVMWKLKDSAEGAAKAENARTMKAGLEALKNVIPEIRLLEVGINGKEGPDSFDIVLCSEFLNWEDLDRYQNHPEHRKLAEFVSKIRSERRFVDYEI